MPSEIQRKNHRIHPCNTERKNELLNFLLPLYADKKILILTAQNPKNIQITNPINVTIATDDELIASEKSTYDVLISYDLPEKAILYMTRFAHAREIALILLGAEDQKNLYGIETLLGRTIIQEPIVGFEPDFGIAVEQKSKAEALARRVAREDEAASKGDKWARKERGSSEFLGHDENGKPMFAKKSRDRNHTLTVLPVKRMKNQPKRVMRISRYFLMRREKNSIRQELRVSENLTERKNRLIKMLKSRLEIKSLMVTKNRLIKMVKKSLAIENRLVRRKNSERKSLMEIRNRLERKSLTEIKNRLIKMLKSLSVTRSLSGIRKSSEIKNRLGTRSLMEIKNRLERKSLSVTRSLTVTENLLTNLHQELIQRPLVRHAVLMLNH